LGHALFDHDTQPINIFLPELELPIENLQGHLRSYSSLDMHDSQEADAEWFARWVMRKVLAAEQRKRFAGQSSSIAGWRVFSDAADFVSKRDT
jgi:hypothetical protein